MFLLDTIIEVNFKLPATAVSYVYTDFDIILERPDKSSSYLDAAIDSSDFIAPTTNTTGAVTYRLNADQKGVWKVILTSGVSAAAEIRLEYVLEISVSDTHIYQQVKL